MSDEHSNTLSQLNDVQQQNNQLDQQIGSLKAELDHLRVDAELQKSSGYYTLRDSLLLIKFLGIGASKSLYCFACYPRTFV